MGFGATDSVTSTIMNNLVRGLYRDNSDHAITGSVSETTLGSFTITANTIGATGLVEIMASGTIAGTNNTKTIKVYFGSTVAAQIIRNAGSTASWVVTVRVRNTAAAAQRITHIRSTDSASTMDGYYNAGATENTAADVLVKVTGTLANTGDTITETTLEAVICQIT